MLVRLPATLAVADAVQKIKGGSSKWIHDTWPERRSFQWQRGYGAFSVSRSGIEAVSRYIDEQQRHHARVDFKTEFLSLLEKHEIDYAPTYLWR